MCVQTMCVHTHRQNTVNQNVSKGALAKMSLKLHKANQKNLKIKI